MKEKKKIKTVGFQHTKWNDVDLKQNASLRHAFSVVGSYNKSNRVDNLIATCLLYLLSLTHSYLGTRKRVCTVCLRPFYGFPGKNNVASDQGLHYLLIRFSIKNRIKATKNRPNTPEMTNGLVRYIQVEKSISI